MGSRVRAALGGVAAAMAAVAAGLALSMAPAQAADDPGARADAYQADHPGGVRISDDKVSYQGGKVVIEFLNGDAASVQEADPCPEGYYCLYSKTGYEDSRVVSDADWCEGGLDALDLSNFGLANAIYSVDNYTGKTLRMLDDDSAEVWTVDPWALREDTSNVAGERYVCAK